MKAIYLDHNATSPVREEALERYRRAAVDHFGNASSVHAPGRDARRALDAAREEVAAALGAHAREIVFTGGGTESDNLAIVGLAQRRRSGHIVTSAVEHPAVLATCRALESRGFGLTVVPVDATGRVDPDVVLAAVGADTILVSIMMVNNETGVVQPIEEIGARIHERGIPLHSDAVQAFGRLPVDLASLPVDLLSISGHKFGAVKGVGALFVRDGLMIDPILRGGGQENDRRSGTYNVAAAAALATAATLARDGRAAEMTRLEHLRDAMEAEVCARIDGAAVNGRAGPRVTNTSNLHLPGADGEAVVLALDAEGIAVSSASACASAWRATSHVLTAMGLSAREADDSIRVSLGRTSTTADVEAFVRALPGAVERLRTAAGPPGPR
jgi:cysteine desulfurase